VENLTECLDSLFIDAKLEGSFFADPVFEMMTVGKSQALILGLSCLVFNKLLMTILHQHGFLRSLSWFVWLADCASFHIHKMSFGSFESRELAYAIMFLNRLA